MKRLLAILKDLQDSGQEAAITGQFTIQAGHLKDVTNVNNVCERPKDNHPEAGASKSSNRDIAEQEQNDEKGHSLTNATFTLAPELVEVIGTWSILPYSVKAGILAMVRATT